MDVCAASSGVGIIVLTPLLLSRRENACGGRERSPPRASTGENNIAVLRQEVHMRRRITIFISPLMDKPGFHTQRREHSHRNKGGEQK